MWLYPDLASQKGPGLTLTPEDTGTLTPEDTGTLTGALMPLMGSLGRARSVFKNYGESFYRCLHLVL